MTQSVTIERQATLHIEPGVTVLGSTDAALNVLGALDAVGTEASPITFAGNNQERWAGIRFGDASSVEPTELGGSRLIHSVVREAFKGIDLRGYRPTLQNDQILNNIHGLTLGSSGIVVEESVFRGNGYGILGPGSDITVTGSDFAENGTGAVVRTGSWTLHGNDFVANDQYALWAEIDSVSQGLDAQAQDNWWGTTDATLIEQAIYDAADDPARADIDWEPASTSPNTPWEPTDPEPAVHQLSVTLSLRKGNRPGYLVARGAVTVDDGHIDCYMTATIYVQRRINGVWKTQRWGDAVNKDTGLYRLGVRREPGRYRTLIKRYDYNEAEACSGAKSPVRFWPP